jgi:hypothetical protein
MIMFWRFDYIFPEPFTDLKTRTIICYHPNSQVSFDGVIKAKRVNWTTYKFGEPLNNRPLLWHDVEIEFVPLLHVPEQFAVPR